MYSFILYSSANPTVSWNSAGHVPLTLSLLDENLAICIIYHRICHRFYAWKFNFKAFQATYYKINISQYTTSIKLTTTLTFQTTRLSSPTSARWTLAILLRFQFGNLWFTPFTYLCIHLSAYLYIPFTISYSLYFISKTQQNIWIEIRFFHKCDYLGFAFPSHWISVTGIKCIQSF